MNTLFEKAFNHVYSMRINAYVAGDDLARMYAHEMKNYCEKRGHSVHYEDVYDYAYMALGIDEDNVA